MVRVLQPGGTLLMTRRQGWEDKTFIGRYRSREQYEEYRRSLGFTNMETLPWQVDYNQVFIRKRLPNK